jgi:hypothetical protein
MIGIQFHIASFHFAGCVGSGSIKYPAGTVPADVLTAHVGFPFASTPVSRAHEPAGSVTGLAVKIG